MSNFIDNEEDKEYDMERFALKELDEKVILSYSDFD
jgi:hypothetical protein